MYNLTFDTSNIFKLLKSKKTCDTRLASVILAFFIYPRYVFVATRSVSQIDSITIVMISRTVYLFLTGHEYGEQRKTRNTT